MGKRERTTSIWPMAAAAVLLVLACGPCSLLSGSLPTPPHRIVVSSEAASQLRSRIEQSMSGQPGQEFILRISDAELTSLLSLELAKYDESPVSRPVVWFTRGKIYATGRLVNIVPISADFYLVAAPRIEGTKAVVAIEELSAGALPIPKRALDTISQSINETVDEAQLDVAITGVEILEGEAILRGILK